MEGHLGMRLNASVELNTMSTRSVLTICCREALKHTVYGIHQSSTPMYRYSNNILFDNKASAHLYFSGSNYRGTIAGMCTQYYTVTSSIK